MAPTSIEPLVVNKQQLIHMLIQVVDLFVALSSGARLMMVSYDIKLAPHVLVPLLMQERVTVLQATPSFLHLYGARILAAVRHLQCSNSLPLWPFRIDADTSSLSFLRSLRVLALGAFPTAAEVFPRAQLISRSYAFSARRRRNLPA
jgi:hypothetical protein